MKAWKYMEGLEMKLTDEPLPRMQEALGFNP
jgi:hypothetical protein